MRRHSPTRAAKTEPMKPPAPVTTTFAGMGIAGSKGRKRNGHPERCPFSQGSRLRYGQFAGVAVMVTVTMEAPSVTVTDPVAG